ncbi:MAG: N-acetylglucosamine-6-phosphate deacetylase [Anaerolineae bacterium]
MGTIIRGGTVLTPDTQLEHHSVVIDAGRITAIIPNSDAPDSDYDVLDAPDCWIVPGFIDVHVHGAAGYDVMDGTPEALHGIARAFARHGVTGFYATTLTASNENINAAIKAVRSAKHPSDGAQILGIHLEGPYFNAEYKGAQPGTFLRPPDPSEYIPWFHSGLVKLMSLAPELPGALEAIRTGRALGVEFAAGHTAADYDTVSAAADAGLRQGTHTFNGMVGLHHRRPGPAGAILTDDRIYAQIITDGIHVHPAMVKLLVRAKGIDRTLLVTDAIRATGLSDGTYQLGAHTINVQKGIARLAEGNLAGSTLTMDAAIRNVMTFAGVSLPEAVAMATRVPAEAMGIDDQKGRLKPGADADLVILNRELQVVLTMVGERVAFRASPQKNT